MTAIKLIVPLAALFSVGQTTRDSDGGLTRAERISKLQIQQSLLELRRAETELQEAQIALEGTERLFEKRIATIEELRRDEQAVKRSELALEKARIDLEKARLEFLKDATLITVVDATKRRTPAGLYMADVTIRNDSDLSKARVAMDQATDATDQGLSALLNIDNIIVTLVGSSQFTDETGNVYLHREAIIGKPYQHIIPTLRYGEKMTLTYELLQKDVETVTVRLEYLGQKLEYPVFLSKEATEDLPTITASPFAQQGRLGEKVYYNLELERLATTEKSFSPVVLNLPLSIPFGFVDPTSGAKVTQFRFTTETSKQTIQFEVSIPEKLDKELVDQTLTFEIIITSASELKAINDLRAAYVNKDIPIEEVQKIKGSRTSLQLRPQGVGKLDILIANSFMEISQGENSRFKFTIYNSGTLALRKVTPEIDLPLEWEGETEPRLVDIIDPDQKLLFVAEGRPPTDVSIGEYTIKVACEGSAGVETVEAIDQDFTIRLVGKRNITGMAILVGVLILLVLMIAVASVKIARR
jgi:hypothetical protein